MHYMLFLVLLFGISLKAEAKEDSLKKREHNRVLKIGQDYGTDKSSLELPVSSRTEFLNRDTTWLKVGGAFRLNNIYTHYEGETFPLGTFLRNEWTWDTWRINVDAYSEGIQLSFEYRFYPTFNTHFLKYGWLGYRFNEKTNLKMGVTQVPFGLLTYASHSWWFQLPYYLGLEDDFQMGFHLSHQIDDWRLDGAYFLLAEPRGTNEATFGAFSTARYSYDVVPIPGNSNIERHQVNLRAVRTWSGHELGISLQHHELYNLQTGHKGSNLAASVHHEANWGNWNLKAEAIYYTYDDVRNDDGEVLDVVQMGAYGFGTYDVANSAALYVIGLAYDIPLDWGPVSNVQLYNDYTLMEKFTSEQGRPAFAYRKSQQNVFGALVSAGQVYAYFDVAMGYNHPWLTNTFGGNALGTGRGVDYRQPISDLNPTASDPGWNTRLNINIGYYF
ncbi:hypothetical protein [Cyclobacterium salsum]|uniref:hypothetical protein n=1 Tax=Cyclobacterium salsum TaxID=2666329 RepID=UPI0013918AB4|nr:hypothetical protein [Cyclobacterium salsum]